MADSYIGEIRAFSFGFVPQGWLACDGTSYLQQQYPALYSILGRIYTGTNVANSNFQVPDLRGMTLTGTQTGQSIITPQGAESVLLAQNNLPAHNHTLQGFTHTSAQNALAVNTPGSTVFLSNGNGQPIAGSPGVSMYSNTSTAGTVMNVQSLGNTPATATQPHENRMPFAVFSFCICVEGEYPMRD